MIKNLGSMIIKTPNLLIFSMMKILPPMMLMERYFS